MQTRRLSPAQTFTKAVMLSKSFAIQRIRTISGGGCKFSEILLKQIIKVLQSRFRGYGITHIIYSLHFCDTFILNIYLVSDRTAVVGAVPHDYCLRFINHQHIRSTNYQSQNPRAKTIKNSKMKPMKYKNNRILIT